MGQKLYATLLFISLILFSIVNSDDSNDAGVSDDEVTDGPKEEQKAN